MDYDRGEVPSPVGPIGFAVTASGVVAVTFGPAVEAERAVVEGIPGAVRAELPLADVVRAELTEYFAGDRESFDVPIDWRLATGFQARALRALYGTVGYGRTVSYGELAARVHEADGKPGEPSHEAARAVGRAMATNPVPVIVPCHRVLASDGSLHGFGGGLESKRRLLVLEGSEPATFDDLLTGTGA